jgi:mono/diheme cytochrome c family protein
MKYTYLLPGAVVAVAAAAFVLASRPAQADATAGKATFTSICAECHEAGDFEGEDPKALSQTIHEIVAGTHKHKKKLTLNDQQISDVAAYLAAGGK